MSLVDKFRKKTASVEKLQQQFSNKTREEDSRFWKPTIDNETGYGSAVFRFLPDPSGEQYMAQYQEHWFKGEKGWYKEKCPKSLDQEAHCPACNSFWKGYNEYGEDASNMPDNIRRRGANRHYVSNILILEDPLNPENVGKVFLFNYKRFFFNQIMECIKPEEPGATKFQPFDIWEGANFNLKISPDKRFTRNYNKSHFMEQSELYNGDEGKIENVLKQLIELDEFRYEEEIKALTDSKLNELFYKATGEGLLNESEPEPMQDLIKNDDSVISKSEDGLVDDTSGNDLIEDTSINVDSSDDGDDDSGFDINKWDDLLKD